MKYYIGNIDEQYGEFEVEQSFLFATAGDDNQLMEGLPKNGMGWMSMTLVVCVKVCTGMTLWPMGLVVTTR